MTLLISEITLVLVHLAVVAGFSRVYADSSFAPPLVAVVVVAHVMASVGRRRRVPISALAPLATAAGVLLTVWVLFGHTTALGIPTTATWEAMQEAASVSRSQFRTMIAPAPVLTGFQMWACFALWGAVWFADWAAFRLRTTVEAVSPALLVFVFCATLGRGQHRFASVALFTAATLLFVAAHRAHRSQMDSSWLVSDASVGPSAVLRAGVAMAAVALVGGAVVGPRLPGSGSDALLEWRGTRSGGGSRTTVSPIVDLQSRLVDQSDSVFFTVTSDAPSYWRLTGLDQFDGRLWRIDGEFSLAEGSLGSDMPDVPAERRITQTFRIQGLNDIWVPAAFEASSVTSASGRLRWDPRSSTLISDADSATGLTYTVVSAGAAHPPEVLARADGPDPARLAPFRSLPADFPEIARTTASSVTQVASNRYEQALSLQNWFRHTFEYSLEVETGHGDDALVAFLQSKRGYCEQFAGAYAAMARSLGIPARVAVGFTQGEEQPDKPGTYVVRGRHAHAWPEVWFDGIGWVPFEPTPGRGMPGAEPYTGVPADQDETTAPSTPDSTTTTSTTLPDSPVSTQPGAPTTTSPVAAPVSTDERGGQDTSSPTPGWQWALMSVVTVVAVWFALVLAVPLVRRRRPHRSGPAGQVSAAWQRALISARWLTGLRPRTSETHVEFAARAGVADLDELAALATVADWGPGEVTDADVARANAVAEALAATAHEHGSWFARLRRRLSWREALQSSVSSPS